MAAACPEESAHRCCPRPAWQAAGARSDEPRLGDLGSEELAGGAIPLVGPVEISGPDGPAELDSVKVCLVSEGAAAGILTPRMSTRLGPARHGQRTQSTVGPDGERDRQRLVIGMPFRHDRVVVVTGS